jgi:hypothetical protein
MGKISVLGLGPSLSLFNPSDFDLSIGVNDIWRYHHSEVVVCVDARQNFTRDRMKVIDECKPKTFYSQMATYQTRPDYQKIEILSSYPDVTCDLSGYKFQRSFCSPFIAVQIAFRWYDTKEIHLFGVDLLNHPHIDSAMCDRIKVHFMNLKRELLKDECKLIVHGDGILKDI